MDVPVGVLTQALARRAALTVTLAGAIGQTHGRFSVVICDEIEGAVRDALYRS